MTALAGRVAVVTGASRGIGAATAEALRRAGATVARLARSLDDGARGSFHDLRCDVTDPIAVAAAAERVRAGLGVPEVVVSNAGAFLLQSLDVTTPDALEGQIAANLRGPYYVARAFLPSMRSAGRGVFVTVGSIADHVGFPGNSAYAATKYGLRGLHESLVAEFRGTGVRLTLLSPGPTDTAIWDPVDPDARPGLVPRAAMLRPVDVAEAVLFAVTRPAHVHVDWLRINPAAS
jgi:NAD(P)-dependent dehydrogenase (short-subunit alcohol dehydrogenase family)